MPTYCIPALSGVPGFPANEFDWWTLSPPPDPGLRFSPDNPNWLGAFSLSEGVGANRHLHFRALRGEVSGVSYLFLSWVIRVASLDTGIDRVNALIGAGGNYLAFQVRLGSTSSTVAGTQNDGKFSYRIHECTVTGSTISTVNPPLASDGADLETTGRMWVDDTSDQRNLYTSWAFQVAVPLGTAWAPSSFSLPTSGSFKLWYEVSTSLPGATALYQVPTTPPGVQTTSVLQVLPSSLQVAHLLDLSTGTSGCDSGVELNWGDVGVRNVDAGDPARPGLTTIRLDLGQDYPPNAASSGSPYNVTHTPNVSDSEFQNQFFAQPTLPGGLSSAQRDALRARFSLANWGSQISISTASSWRPIPGGEDVNYQSATGEMRFVWPQPEPDGTADSFTTTLVRNINKYLNAVGTGSTIPSDAQNPHQCVLVELSSTDPSVVITRSSIYQNMNVARASVFRRFAEISTVGLEPISAQPRDVYLFLQTFNMPKIARGKDHEDMKPALNQMGMRGHVGEVEMPYEVEDVAARYPTYIVHAFHDTGKTLALEDGRQVPILRPQTSFGYFALHDGNLYGWETRLYGAQKITENFYRLGVPNQGSRYVETAIQARESASERPLPEDEATGCCKGLVAWLNTMGPLGRVASLVVRIICRLLGQ